MFTNDSNFITSTVTGDFIVDTTLKVDSSNNRVGIGTASPTKDLELITFWKCLYKNNWWNL